MATTLPVWVETFNAAAHGAALMAAIARDRWQWLQEYRAQLRRYARKNSQVLRDLERTTAAHVGLLRASAGIPALRQQICNSLLQADVPLPLPLGILRGVQKHAADIRALGLATVHAYCVQTLETRLAQPARSAEDWSITLPAAASKYEPGKTLAQFLSASDQRVLSWRLVQDARETVERIIAQYELPVRHETLRTGRPYTLKLEKLPSLFTHETAERHQWASDLDWLRQTQDAFGAA